MADSRIDLARSSIGMAVRAGAPKPDISSVEALKRTLLQAKSIAYSASVSGRYLSTELFPRLGIADQVMGKSRRIEGERVGDVVARGEAEIGFQQISELLPVRGIDYVGPLPPEVQRTSCSQPASQQVPGMRMGSRAHQMSGVSGSGRRRDEKRVGAHRAETVDHSRVAVSCTLRRCHEAGDERAVGGVRGRVGFDRGIDCRRLVREPVGAEAARHDDHDGAVGRSRRILPAGRRRRGGQAYSTLPAFCRVAATIKPTSDSDIKVEVWLPASGWNGKYQAVGNGGWAGSITYGAMARALRDGYATSSTDTGHTGGNASFALGHPEKLVDYAYRAVHEMTVKSKAIANAFYGTDAKRSYFNGCSTGGRQALIAAQRFPNDFDGIVAGAAANPKSGLDAWRIWMTQAMLKDKASFIPEEKHRVIHQAVLNACDALDGVEDGLIENPTRCRFDPAMLACRGADGPNCLTAAQVETAKVVMSPVKNRRTGELIFPGFEPGTELGWARLLSGPDPYPNAVEQFKYIVFKDPKWDWRTFDLERDLAAAEKAGQGTLASIDPNLTAFVQRGGKLITYHGWSEQQHRAAGERQLLFGALAATKAPARGVAWLRLYMVPGMGHCSGGEGPNTFDMMGPLDSWVESGTLPPRVGPRRSLRAKSSRTRPLCPYPQVARYKGREAWMKPRTSRASQLIMERTMIKYLPLWFVTILITLVAFSSFLPFEI